MKRKILTLLIAAFVLSLPMQALADSGVITGDMVNPVSYTHLTLAADGVSSLGRRMRLLLSFHAFDILNC